MEQDPPDPECRDKPYEASLVVTTLDQSKVVKEFRSMEDGTFRVSVPPGEYAIRSAAAANTLPYCSSEKVVVREANYTSATVHCDTGIRF